MVNIALIHKLHLYFKLLENLQTCVAVSTPYQRNLNYPINNSKSNNLNIYHTLQMCHSELVSESKKLLFQIILLFCKMLSLTYISI